MTTNVTKVVDYDARRQQVLDFMDQIQQAVCQLDPGHPTHDFTVLRNEVRTYDYWTLDQIEDVNNDVTSIGAFLKFNPSCPYTTVMALMLRLTDRHLNWSEQQETITKLLTEPKTRYALKGLLSTFNKSSDSSSFIPQLTIPSFMYPADKDSSEHLAFHDRVGSVAANALRQHWANALLNEPMVFELVVKLLAIGDHIPVTEVHRHTAKFVIQLLRQSIFKFADVFRTRFDWMVDHAELDYDRLYGALEENHEALSKLLFNLLENNFVGSVAELLKAEDRCELINRYLKAALDRKDMPLPGLAEGVHVLWLQLQARFNNEPLNGLGVNIYLEDHLLDLAHETPSPETVSNQLFRLGMVFYNALKAGTDVIS